MDRILEGGLGEQVRWRELEGLRWHELAVLGCEGVKRDCYFARRLRCGHGVWGNGNLTAGWVHTSLCIAGMVLA